MTQQKIPKIEEFLQQWGIKAKEHYTSVINKLDELRVAYEIIPSGVDILNYSKEKRQEIRKEHKLKYDTYAKFNYANDNISRIMFPEKDRGQRLDAMIKKEIDRKRIALINRIEKKAGEIIDASGLQIVSGDINGVIKGGKCSVKVNTISAGGYNIQCLHYRVLIKEVRYG